MIWSAQDDSELRKAIRREGGIRAAARALGISECAAIARNARRQGRRFPSDQKRHDEFLARRAKEDAILNFLRLELAEGSERNGAIRRAFARGARKSAIARAVGLFPSHVDYILKRA